MALRTELLMADHPRWRLISTVETITLVDLAKLLKIVEYSIAGPGKRIVYQTSNIWNMKAKENDDDLEEIYNRKIGSFFTNQFTDPSKPSYLAMLLNPQKGVDNSTPSQPIKPRDEDQAKSWEETIVEKVELLQATVKELRQQN